MSDARADIIAALKGFFAKEFLDGDEGGLDAQTNLLEAGLVNSQVMVKLTGFIVDQWGMRVPFKHLTPDNLKSLQTIADLILKLRA